MKIIIFEKLRRKDQKNTIGGLARPEQRCMQIPFSDGSCDPRTNTLDCLPDIPASTVPVINPEG